MATSDLRHFPARLSALPDTAMFAQAFCTGNHVARDDSLRLTFIIEELFTNTVTHGYGGDSDATIHIALSLTDAGVAVVYADAAPRHDPLARLADAPTRPTMPLELRPVGGLGVRLVDAMAANVRYEYAGGKNRISLTLPFTA